MGPEVAATAGRATYLEDGMTIRRIAFAVLVLLLAGCGQTLAPAQSLIVRGDRLFISISINGVETEALLDSAAEATFVDAAFISKLGLEPKGAETAKGTGGEQEVSFVEGVNIEALGVKLNDLTVATFDLADLSRRVIGQPTNVILGRELFDATRLEIDIEGGGINAVSRHSDPEGVRLPLKARRGVETIPVSIEGASEIDADFDLGNGSEILIGAGYAERTGLNAPERIIGEKRGGGVGGEVARKLVRLGDVEIAGVHFTDVVAAIDETAAASDANVGVSLLRRFKMTIDFAEGAVWLSER
ncbi:MAG: retropepsin-like domain-containing protein [Parvularculaceae bacterium]|nr:retropepsin-like domain-containing protein [Parvularculaceae bacterium]